jgi:hypothetical protein
MGYSAVHLNFCRRWPFELMMTRFVLKSVGFTAILLASQISRAAVDFQREVRPILSATCFKCHGPDPETRKGGFRLDVREEALKPGKSEKIAIVPGDISKSELVRRILTTDEDDLMPPPKAKMPLTDAQKDILKRWVAEGAEYRPHWAFVAPKRPALSEVKQTDWPRNEVDRFILARLEKEGLKPAEPADKYTVVRRVYLDLIGLPPTPEQADAFVNDSSANAFEKLVDQLLESPQYGERWARRWLDLARYADTNGYEKDRPRSIWAYRDWVINALNKDMPFDQFSIEQLAGDLLPNPTQDQLIATGFHRNTMLNEEGGADPLEYRFHAMVDRVHVTATTWLGLTMACAQCHTHKYDPIQHTEYYGFMAFLDNADEPLLDLKKPDIAKRREETESKIAALEAALLDKFPAPANIEWRVPGEQEFESREGAEGEPLTDGSFRVGGKSPEKDIYTIKFEATVPKLTHVQIEALPDAQVGKGGPGRTDHGNFVVTELELKVRGEKVKFISAEADFSQDGFPPDGAFDGKGDTGWAISGPENLRQHRHAIFKLEKPLAIEKSAPVTVRLKQEYGGKHTLGRFRISLGHEALEGGSIVEKRKQNLERNFRNWAAKQTPKLVKWQRLSPAEVSGDHPTLNVEADDVIFASGDFTKNDTYTLAFKNLPAGVKAIRIEALPDSRLPGSGPGRVFYEGSPGDFFLSNLKASGGDKAVKFKGASQSFAAGGNTAEKAIDEDLQSGWSCNGGQGKSHSAVFNLGEPFAGGDLKIEMTMERYYASALGKFRVWATTTDNAVASGLPEDAVQVLLTHKVDDLKDDSAEKKTLLKAFAQEAPQLASARKEIEKLRNEVPKFPTTLVMQERDPEHRRKTFRRHRGEFLQPKEEIAPRLPAFLPGLPKDGETNRLGFAKWLVSPENPLTARVVMNRQWEAFFGRGLVRTIEDFGFQGETPSHPELLDWLATEFVRRNWSMKQMHKLIVMSAAYQQSSRATPELLQRDPNNVLVSRGPRFRVEAEAVRDAALLASGLLSKKIGGPSVFPPQIASITTEGAYGPLQWKVSEGEDRYRRGLYTFTKRTAPFAMTLTFDGPSGEACLARRDRSNTPLQALTLLNDEIFMDCAKALGRWATKQESEDRTIEEMFRRCVTRPPTAEEKGKLSGFYKAQLERFAKGELKASEFVGSDKGEKLNEQASWTALARVLLNLDETVTKS